MDGIYVLDRSYTSFRCDHLVTVTCDFLKYKTLEDEMSRQKSEQGSESCSKEISDLIDLLE